MSRVRKGTRSLGKGKVLIGSNQKGPRKMRCPGCKSLVAATVGTAGKPVYRCGCGRVFRATTM